MDDLVKLDDFKLVYQGGHHNIYCDSEIHLKTLGGRYHPNIFVDYAIVDYEFKCDCGDYRNVRNSASN